MPKILTAILAVLALLVPTTWAATATPLDRYLEGLKTLRTTFTQTLVDANGRQLDSSSGTLVVSRPGKFRWEIRPEGAAEGEGQLMVADGRNVWFFDRDLEQVTVKPAAAALTATPAALLSGTSDLTDTFEISSAGRREGLEWVFVEPRDTVDADFRGALLGFDGNDLKRMIIEDRLGQTATVAFERIQRNVRVRPEEVSFTPPPGVDVIGTPHK